MDFEELLKSVPADKQASVRSWYTNLAPEKQAEGLANLQAKYAPTIAPRTDSPPVVASDVTATRPGLPFMGREAPTASVGADLGGPRLNADLLPAPGRIRSFGNAVVNAAVPFADEIAGAMTSGEVSGPGYETARRLAEYQMGRGAREHPIETGVGTAVGAVGSALALPAASAEKMATQGLLRRGLTNLGEGMGIGALYGAGAADPGERKTGALYGGLIGGGVGTLSPLLAEVGSSRVGTKAGRTVLDLTEAGDADIQAALQQSRATDGPLAFADVGGPAAESRVRAVRAVPGPGQRTIKEFFANRLAGRPGRTEDAVAEAVGAPRTNSYTAAREMGDLRGEEAERMFDTALQPNGVPVVLDPAKTTPLLRLREVRDLIGEYRAINNLPELQMNAPGLNKVTGPELQYVKRRLAELGQGAEVGNAAKTQAIGRSARNPAEAVGNVLAEVPGYPEANAAYAARSEAMESRQVGSTALQTEPELLEDWISRATQPQMTQARAGFPSSVTKALDSGTARNTLGRLGLGQTPRLGRQRAIEAFIPPEGEAGFSRFLGGEEAMLGAENAALNGSETSVNAGSMMDAARGGHLMGEMRKRVARELLGNVDAQHLAHDANVLTTTGPDLRRVLGEGLDARNQRGAVRRGFNLTGRATANLVPTFGRLEEVAQRSEDEDRYQTLLRSGATDAEARAILAGSR